MNQNPEIKWLKCRVFKGMFSNERVIHYHSPYWKDVEYIVPADQVDLRNSQTHENGEEGKVRVRVFRTDDMTWAVVPTEYSDAVPVNDYDLVAV